MQVEVCGLGDFSRVRLFVIPWAIAHQAPLSMGFSRQEYWSGLPFPSPGDLLYPKIDPGFPKLQADSCLSHQGIMQDLDAPGGRYAKNLSLANFTYIIQVLMLRQHPRVVYNRSFWVKEPA